MKDDASTNGQAKLLATAVHGILKGLPCHGYCMIIARKESLEIVVGAPENQLLKYEFRVT
jgi:hypothetical protein